MTQPPHIPQPPQQPQDGNPYAQAPQQPQQPPQSGQPYAPYPQQPQGGQPYAPFPQQQGGAPAGYPGGYPLAPTQPVGRRGNLGLGILTAVVAMLVAGGVYGAIIGGTEHEIGYAAVGVGFLVGLAAGKVGGNNPVIPWAGAVLSLIGIYFGQLLGEAIIGAKQLPVSVSELFFQHFGLLNQAWKADSDFMTYLFFVVAALAAVGASKKAAS